MKKGSNKLLLIGLLTGLVLGLVAAIYAQSASIARLAEEPANISKMDWILLNTRVHVLEQTLKDDLSLPLSPTSYSYDSEKQKIRISVYVAPSWLAKSSFAQVNKALSDRATALCIAPALGGGNLSMIFLRELPIRYCTIRFFTPALNGAGHAEPKDVASFEDGKLVMK